jgi:gas vesicle protein
MVGILSQLLQERKTQYYNVELSGKMSLSEPYISKALAAALSELKVRTNCLKIITAVPKKKLVVKIDGKYERIPVEIHKISSKKDGIKEIRIRVIGENDAEVRTRLAAIQDYLAEWHITPRECMWSQGGWEKTSDQQSQVRKEQRTIFKNKMEKLLESQQSEIEDLKDEIRNMKNYPLKNAMAEERQVRIGVLR